MSASQVWIDNGPMVKVITNYHDGLLLLGVEEDMTDYIALASDPIGREVD